MPLFGKQSALVSLPKYLQVGRIQSIQVTAGGSGYTNGAAQTVTLTGGGFTIPATATANVVGGVVQSVTVTYPGMGYTSAPTLAIAGAANATFSIKVEANRTTQMSGTVVFVDDTDAALQTNKSKGMHSPGWWLYQERKNSNGDVRIRAELLASITSVTVGAGDLINNLIDPIVESVVTITAGPTAQTTVTGGATFGVTASVSGGGAITYQWEKAPAATPTQFAVVVGQTAATIVLAGQTSANTGDRYRCIVAGGGAKPVPSGFAILTFGT